MTLAGMRNDDRLLHRHLLGVTAHNEMYLIRGEIDLIEQALEVNGAAGASRGDDDFHE